MRAVTFYHFIQTHYHGQQRIKRIRIGFTMKGTKPEKFQNINRFSQQKAMPKRASKPYYEMKHLGTLNDMLYLFHKCHYKCPLILGITGNNGNETSLSLPCQPACGEPHDLTPREDQLIDQYHMVNALRTHCMFE